jgi:hypothetical protein
LEAAMFFQNDALRNARQLQNISQEDALRNAW